MQSPVDVDWFRRVDAVDKDEIAVAHEIDLTLDLRNLGCHQLIGRSRVAFDIDVVLALFRRQNRAGGPHLQRLIPASVLAFAVDHDGVLRDGLFAPVLVHRTVECHVVA